MTIVCNTRFMIKTNLKKAKKKKYISSSTLANCIYFYWTFDTSCMIRKVIRFSQKASVMYCWNFYEKCSCLGFLTLTCSYLKSLLFIRQLSNFLLSTRLSERFLSRDSELLKFLMTNYSRHQKCVRVIKDTLGIHY